MYTYPHIPPDTPQFQSMLGPYQDDGFGQLIYAPSDTYVLGNAIIAEGINEFCVYPWHELYAGH